MCKFQKPQLPEGATTDERRSAMFDALCSLDLSDKTEKRDSLTYLSWANAWGEFKRAYPSATFRVVRNPETHLPYFSDPLTGIMVFVEITADGITQEAFLPVMDNKNKAMRFEPYTYQAWDSYKKTYVEKTVNAATMFDINKTIMRCLVKNIALFGLGLYIYAGEDVPEKTSSAEDMPLAEPTTTRPSSSRKNAGRTQHQQPPVDKYIGIRNAINSSMEVASLMSLYLDHQNEIEGNPEIKALLTQRKLQLKNTNS